MNDLKDFFKGKKVLVTGHTGFKGAWLAYALGRWGADVAGVALPPDTKPNLFSILGLEKVMRNYFVDIRDFTALKGVFEKEKPEIVIHLAAQALLHEGYEKPLTTISTNVLGTSTVLEAVKRVGSVRAAVIITTDKVYAKSPDNMHRMHAENDRLGGYDPYSASKAAADIVANSYIQSFFNPAEYKKSHMTLVAIARSGNVVGGGDWGKDRLVPDIIRDIFENKKAVAIRNPGHMRPWEHVLEPLHGYLLLAKHLYNGNVKASGPWNFGPDEENIVPVSYIAAKAIDRFKGEEGKVSAPAMKHETEVLKLHSGKAKQHLQWKPRYGIDATLALTFEWYERYYENPGSARTITEEQIDAFFGR